jgi:hypothetical protein
MKTGMAAIALMIFANSSPAQKNDNTWIFGYYYSSFMPVAGLDFYYGYPDTVGFNPPFSFVAGACVSMSDSAGNLIFFTNGDQVSDWNNQIMHNSTGFNSLGDVNDYWQGAIAVPYPDLADQYCIFHLSGVYYNNFSALNPFALYYSLVDMGMNGGLGSMTQKNLVAFSDTLMPCAMQAARHGNGRDWWIINKKGYSNGIYISLLTPAGMVQNTLTFTGPYLSYFLYSEGQSNVSPDGSMYAIAYNTFNAVYLYDFNRCDGTIAFRDSVQIIPNDSSEWPVWGCSFSPSSRYLYATTNNDLYQYDTWNANLASSQKWIAAFDGFTDPFYNYFYRHANGPDGKIYMTSWGSTRYLHVINDSDQPDTACNFVQHQLKLINYHGSVLPDFPNYRLGALTGSPCDTITSLPDPALSAGVDFLLFPNPSQGTIRISYNLLPGQNGRLEITSLQGSVLLKKTLPQWSNQQALDLGRLADGIYLAAVSTGGRTAAAKLVLQR